MKVLITGANGYLGQGITKCLLDLGHDVFALDYSIEHIDDRAKRIECDIFDGKCSVIREKNIDMLLHLAWRDGFVHYSDNHIIDLPKHYMFVKNAISSGIKRIAIMGSMHEVGFFEGSINEKTPCNPITPYGISKNALRNLVQVLCKQSNVDFQWLRGFYIVGDSKYGSSIFSKIIQENEKGSLEFPFTMGLNQFDFIDYDDFCKYVVAVISQNEKNGIINICSGRPERLADRVERFISEKGLKIKLKYGAFPDRPYDSKAVWGDDTILREILAKDGNVI